MAGMLKEFSWHLQYNVVHLFETRLKIHSLTQEVELTLVPSTLKSVLFLRTVLRAYIW